MEGSRSVKHLDPDKDSAIIDWLYNPKPLIDATSMRRLGWQLVSPRKNTPF